MRRFYKRLTGAIEDAPKVREQSYRAVTPAPGDLCKICFGTRSESELKTHSILPSLAQIARRQGIPPREFLQTLLVADTGAVQQFELKARRLAGKIGTLPAVLL
jgi:hypothetical protein